MGDLNSNIVDDAHWDSFDNPPTYLMNPVRDGFPGVAFESGRWREKRIWEGYFSASAVLLEALLERPQSRSLIFPALFNLRHAIEVALKWHIRYAGGIVPLNAGHNLEILIASFREATNGLDEDAAYMSEHMLSFVSELASLDPRAVAFRYPNERNGSPIEMPHQLWDIEGFCIIVAYLEIWFDHLKGDIDMSEPAFSTTP